MSAPVKEPLVRPTSEQSPATIPRTGKKAIVYDVERDVHRNSKGELTLTGAIGNQPAVRTIDFPVLVSENKELIRNNGGNDWERTIPEYQSISLIGGTNWVDAELWEKLKASKQPAFERRVKNGSIIERQPVKDSEEGYLSDYSEEDAMFFVDNCYSEEALNLWSGNEKRPAVIGYLYKRQQELRNSLNLMGY
jgi:hypothetical protein